MISLHSENMSQWKLSCSAGLSTLLSAGHVAEAFTGTPGKYVKLQDTVRSFKEIVEGKYDDLPEQAFYMAGAIEEVIEKAEKLGHKR